MIEKTAGSSQPPLPAPWPRFTILASKTTFVPLSYSLHSFHHHYHHHRLYFQNHLRYIIILLLLLLFIITVPSSWSTYLLNLHYLRYLISFIGITSPPSLHHQHSNSIWMTATTGCHKWPPASPFLWPGTKWGIVMIGNVPEIWLDGYQNY